MNDIQAADTIAAAEIGGPAQRLLDLIDRKGLSALG
jgi:hypothetical protein